MKLFPIALLLALALPSYAQDEPAVDPMADPLVITAGFLTHHPDLKFRLLGMEAYEEKRYDDAMRLFRRASFYADKGSQGMVAEMLWNGEGAPKNRPLAYAWMDLASERGYRGFLGLRERYWKDLSPDERKAAIEQGQAVYARFGDAAAKPRYEAQLRQGRRNIAGSRTGFSGGVKILVPGPGGMQTIEGSKFYDERYWDAQQYWAWNDSIWMEPAIGRVDVGSVETVREPLPSRIPETAPEADAPEPPISGE